jgi:hypothetical protein
MLLPHARHLVKAQDKMVKLPFVWFDAQKKMIKLIVAKGALWEYPLLANDGYD